MEFKKCVRCGCFFASDNNICSNCESKDSADIVKLNSFVNDSDYISSIDELSSSTGVSSSNINRFIEEKKFRLL